MGLDADSLDMLAGRATLTRAAGEDGWGNDVYAAPETIPIYLDRSTEALSQPEQHNQSDTLTAISATAMTDAVGIQPLDRITASDGVIYEVQTVQTTYDEYGGALYHDLTLSTTSRG